MRREKQESQGEHAQRFPEELAQRMKGFHDRLLSHGAPSLPLLREVMLTDPGSAPL